MMKIKPVLLVFCAFAINIELSAQNCTPDSVRFPAPGYYTDHPTNPDKLPDALLDSAYSSVININVPKDTTIAGFGTFVIDSVTLLRIPQPVEGLFTGLTYSAEPSNFNFPGNSKNCILISGIPTNKNEVGFTTIILHLNTYFNGLGVPRDVDFPFRLSATVGNQEWDSQAKISVFPNPAIGKIHLSTGVKNGKNSSVIIRNIAGSTLLEKHFDHTPERTEINIEDFSTGMYLLTFRTSQTVETIRFTVSEH
jgi:hypothetical protein